MIISPRYVVFAEGVTLNTHTFLELIDYAVPVGLSQSFPSSSCQPTCLTWRSRGGTPGSYFAEILIWQGNRHYSHPPTLLRQDEARRYALQYILRGVNWLHTTKWACEARPEPLEAILGWVFWLHLGGNHPNFNIREVAPQNQNETCPTVHSIWVLCVPK